MATGRSGAPNVSGADYQALAAFRRALRQFLHRSDRAAREAGVTPAQYQLMIIVRGLRPERAPTIQEVADALVLRHHSTVELVDRAESAGLVQRSPDPEDGRRQRLELTVVGADVLEQLAVIHLAELRRLDREGMQHLKDLR